MKKNVYLCSRNMDYFANYVIQHIFINKIHLINKNFLIMKKFFLFVAAAMMSVSTFAANISCADAKAKIDADDKNEYTVEGFVTEIIDVANPLFNNITFWMADAADGGQVFEVYRLSFKGKDAGDIPVLGDKVAVTATLQKYKDTYETNKIKSYSIVTKGSGERYTADDLEVEPVTVAKAVEIATALDGGEGAEVNTKKFYEVTGYVVKIKEAYSEQYKNMTFYMSDDASAKSGDLQAYRASVNAQKGDQVKVSGYLSKYVGTNASGTFTSISIKGGKAEVIGQQGIEDVVLTEKAQKVMVDGVVYIVRDGKMYNALGTQVR